MNIISPPSRHVNQQTVAWLRDLHKRGLLDLDPPYQRKSVWNLAYRQYFVETVLLQYPSPAIFLYRTISSDSGTESYSVVDGKQRLETLFRFAEDDFALSDKSQIEQLRGNVFSQLGDYKAIFWSYPMTIEYIPSVEENTLNNIFDRINRNTIRLTPQELRHARFSGRFISTTERLAEYVTEISSDVPRIVAPSRQQMKDIEFIADLLLMLEDGPRGFSINDLDAAFSERDEEWENETVIERRFRHAFEVTNRILSGAAGSNLRTTRLRNQADYYSLFGAIDDILTKSTLDENEVAGRLSSFVAAVEDPERRDNNTALSDYYVAARSASNDTRSRRIRIAILHDVITGKLAF